MDRAAVGALEGSLFGLPTSSIIAEAKDYLPTAADSRRGSAPPTSSPLSWSTVMTQSAPPICMKSAWRCILCPRLLPFRHSSELRRPQPLPPVRGLPGRCGDRRPPKRAALQEVARDGAGLVRWRHTARRHVYDIPIRRRLEKAKAPSPGLVIFPKTANKTLVSVGFSSESGSLFSKWICHCR